MKKNMKPLIPRLFVPLSLSLGLSVGLIGTAQASVVPSNTHPAPTTDMFINYQWALWNSGQKVLNDIDDIHPEELTGSPSIQIGWKPSFDQMMKRDVVVAVIDSGLDTSHEDIQGHIALNEVECDHGHIPTSITGDPDKNGFDGDCMGWNFATRNKQMERFVDDDLGHGTHIAGIIAAVSGNGVGISGVSNRIKILPLKVYSSSDETAVSSPAGGPPTQLDSVSTRVAKAIDYAVARKVDVINLSLGWPLVNNSEKVKASLKNAIDHDTLVVAGAGNDRHEAQIYPCALEGVVCVGSINIDGRVSRFSNFGGHVDVLAPGDNILSLWPTTASTATVFGPKGYEVLSGTSQATPYVSGALAILRGIYPQLPAKELRGKLLAAAAASTAKEEFTLRGLINIEKSINTNTDKVILPSFKELDHVVVNAQTGEFTLPVRLSNYGPSASTVSVRVVSLNPHVSLDQPAANVSVAADGLQTISVRGKAQNLKASAVLRYQVSINGQAYTHQIFLTLDLTQNFSVRTYSFGDNGPTSGLSTVKVMGNTSSNPEYFTMEKGDHDLTIRIYRPAKVNGQNQMTLAGQMQIPGASNLIGVYPVIKTDLNGDKQPDYFISSMFMDPSDDQGSSIKTYFSYFSGANFQPLFPGASTVTINDPRAPYVDGSTLHFVTVPTKDFGKIALPLFWSTAGVPKVDADPDPFNFEPVDVQARRLYFFELERSGTGQVNFVTRLYDNYAFYKDLRKKLNIQVTQDLNLYTLFGQSNADAGQGVLRILGSYGNGILRNWFQLKVQSAQVLTHASQILKMSVNGLDLQRQGFDDAITYNSTTGQVDVGTVMAGVFSVNHARTVVFDDKTESTSVLANLDVQNSDKAEHFYTAGSVHLRTFVIDRQPISFFEGETRLIAEGSMNGKPYHTESQIYRSSFLPGSAFGQRFVGVLVSNGATQKKPGLFVDNSKIFSTTAQVWTLDENNQLTIPLGLSYSLPENCQTMNPNRWSGQDVAVISCQANGKIQKLMFMGL